MCQQTLRKGSHLALGQAYRVSAKLRLAYENNINILTKISQRTAQIPRMGHQPVRKIDCPILLANESSCTGHGH